MSFREEMIELKTKKSEIISRLSKKRVTMGADKVQYDRLIKAKWVLVEVSRQTQERLKDRIENLVNMCLDAVFPGRDYKFMVNFQIKRGKMECAFTVLEDGHEFTPKDDMGGSTLDIISLALKIILWSIENPRTRPLIIMDEPLKFSGKLMPLAIKIIKELSRKLKIQFIINTHSDEIIDIADRSWEVSRPKGQRSIVIQTQ